MRRRYILAPEAARDLVRIWRYLRHEKSEATANRIESLILDRITFLSRSPGSGHWRRDLTDQEVKFFPIYSFLIVYRPSTRPLQIVAILHGSRDVSSILGDRF
jgi:toxin ParE1/3/4